MAQFAPLSILGEGAQAPGEGVLHRMVNGVPTGEQFLLTECIGKGNFGVVYACTQPDGSRAALKKVPKSKFLTLKATSRLASEFRLLREPDPSRRHPNILYINDVLTSRSHLYMVMPRGGKVRGTMHEEGGGRRREA